MQAYNVVSKETFKEGAGTKDISFKIVRAGFSSNPLLSSLNLDLVMEIKKGESVLEFKVVQEKFITNEDVLKNVIGSTIKPVFKGTPAVATMPNVVFSTVPVTSATELSSIPSGNSSPVALTPTMMSSFNLISSGLFNESANVGGVEIKAIAAITEESNLINLTLNKGDVKLDIILTKTIATNDEGDLAKLIAFSVKPAFSGTPLSATMPNVPYTFPNPVPSSLTTALALIPSGTSGAVSLTLPMIESLNDIIVKNSNDIYQGLFNELADLNGITIKAQARIMDNDQPIVLTISKGNVLLNITLNK
jgi:hypothetical protein